MCLAELCSRANRIPDEFYMDTGRLEGFSTRYYPSEQTALVRQGA